MLEQACIAIRPNASPSNISLQERDEDLTKKDTGLLLVVVLSVFDDVDVGGLVTVTFRKDAHPDEPAGTDVSMEPNPDVDAHDCNS